MRPLPPRGFTLLEMLISTAIFSIISAGLVAGSMALLQSFNGSTNYALKLGAEMRISDYLALDLRRAQTVNISGSGGSTVVTLMIPNFYSYNAANHPTISHRLPVITGSGVFYQDAGGISTVQIQYALQAGSMNRTQTGGIAANLGGPLVTATTAVLASNVQDFQFSIIDSAFLTVTSATNTFDLPLASATSGEVAEVQTQVNFGSTFTSQPRTDSGSGFFNTTLLRNSGTSSLYQY